MSSRGSKWQPPKLSAYTPFFRRFTDERARELHDTVVLYKRVRAMHVASRWARPGAVEELSEALWAWVSENGIQRPENREIAGALDRCLKELLRLETHIFTFPEIDWKTAILTLKEQAELRDFLRAKERFLADESKHIELLKEVLGNVFSFIVEFVIRFAPPIRESGPFAVPLICLIQRSNELLDRVLSWIAGKRGYEVGLCKKVHERIYENACAVSGVVPYTDHKKPIKWTPDADLPPEEQVKAYFKGTPLQELLLMRVPFDFGEARAGHMHVVGGSGAGKTQLLQNLILSDLQSSDPPSLVIVDSQSDLISKITRLRLFDPDDGPLRDRLILIDPRDTESPPALNIFDVDRDRFRRYDQSTREQVTAGIIDTFDYLFSGIVGADLTAKQQVFFRFLARLMLSLPDSLGRNATVLDIIALMDDPQPYRAAMASLPPIQRTFFERDFDSKAFAQTKEQIRYRLNAVLENPTLARLFTAPKNRIDLFREINQGSIICVDTAKDFLKGASAHFGRIFISLVLQAVLERAAIPERQRRRMYLIVDEAAEYFDSNIDDLLTQARKYGVGCLFAHQYLEQCAPALRASLAANTAIKMASAVSTSDARALAPEMRTTTDFILSQPKLRFACHVRDITSSAVSVSIPYGQLEKEPRMSPESYRLFRQRNGARVSAPSETETPPSNSEPSPPVDQGSRRDDPDEADTGATRWN